MSPSFKNPVKGIVMSQSQSNNGSTFSGAKVESTCFRLKVRTGKDWYAAGLSCIGGVQHIMMRIPGVTYAMPMTASEIEVMAMHKGCMTRDEEIEFGDLHIQAEKFVEKHVGTRELSMA